MPKNKTKFSDSWLSNPKYNGWLSKKDESTARCSYCCKVVYVSNMGEAALRSHKKVKDTVKDHHNTVVQFHLSSRKKHQIPLKHQSPLKHYLHLFQNKILVNMLVLLRWLKVL